MTKKRAGSTRAIEALTDAGAEFELIEYEHSPTMDRGYALDTVDVLGLDPNEVFKTLLAEADGKPVVAVVPASARLSLKALARACSAKSAIMMDPAKAERLTGYVTGGISPLGQHKQLPTFIDKSALELPRICVSGGKRTLSVLITPQALASVTNAEFANIAAR